MEFDETNWVPTHQYKTEIIDLLTKDRDEIQLCEDDAETQRQYLKKIIDQLDIYDDFGTLDIEQTKQRTEEEYAKYEQLWREVCNKKFHYNLAIQLISNYPDQDENGPHHRFQNQLLYYNQKQIIKDILQEQKQKTQVQEIEHQESLKHYNKILEIMDHNQKHNGYEEQQLKQITKNNADRHNILFQRYYKLRSLYNSAWTIINAYRCPDEYYNT